MWMPPIELDLLSTPPADTRRPRLVALACESCGRDTLLHFFDSVSPTTWSWRCAYDKCRHANVVTRHGEMITLR